MKNNIAIIGAGNLGTAITEGLLQSGFALPAQVYLTKRNTDTLHSFKARGVQVTPDNREAIRQSTIIILAVKPFQFREVLQEFVDFLDPSRHLLISAVTGVSLEEIQQMLNKPLPLFRAMPNTAIAVGQSMTCISSIHATGGQKETVKELFEKLGKVAFIEDKLMDAATVLGACGTAYAMRYIRANIQGGIEIGFDAATASLIAAQTVKGATELLLQKGTHPEQEIDKVTTPRGCTIAGLNEMEHQGFSSALIKGISVSYNKIVKG
jgi:pyrroline-5-carboxylate reductase